jgi:hypothetical protein
MNQRLIDLLRGKGYDVRHDTALDTGWWFTWCHPDGNTDVETGPCVRSLLAAWTSALEHWFANAEIQRHISMQEA